MHFLKFYKILDDTARIVSFFDIFVIIKFNNLKFLIKLIFFNQDKENVRYTTEDPAV